MDTGGPLAAVFLTALADGNGIGNDPPLSDVPFISMMDYNLAIGNNALGGWGSPFNRLIMQNNNSTLYSGMDQVAKRQVFMAGGWNSDSNLTFAACESAGRVNLRYPEFQPFAKCSWFPFDTSLQRCYDDPGLNNPFWTRFNDNFPIISTAMLCDYLDFDSVPISLCIPCTQAVPMLCGVELADGGVRKVGAESYGMTGGRLRVCQTRERS